MPAATSPKQITIRSYQVGFGDCFMLTFHYPAKGTKKAFDRHVLIDFGSFPEMKKGGKSILGKVAAEIKNDCGGKLHAVVATHRHADHVNGFATKADKSGSGDIIAQCNPDVVIQPWTEDPKAQPNAKSAKTKLSAGSRAFAASLLHMNEVADFALTEATRNKGLLRAESGLGRLKVKELEFLGGDNIGNKSAVENLMRMGKGTGKKAFYVSYGTKSGLESVLPGVKTYVLGPPTLEQSDSISKQRVSDPDEFWQLMASALRRTSTGKVKPPFSSHFQDSRTPPYARWLLPRLRALRGDQLLEIVRQLDDQRNNTSVILLFETPNQKLLFPGDAQIENWSYALKEADNSARVRALLKDVTFYKVGHHGSRNATPRTLWDAFAGRKASGKPGRMMAMMSTEEGHHGTVANKSEVPRKTLVQALEHDTEFFTTETIKPLKLKHEVVLPA